jgi:hypothetical protein
LVATNRTFLVFLKCSGAVSFQDRLFAAAQDDTDSLFELPSFFRKL